jgi:hypothetical protein
LLLLSLFGLFSCCLVQADARVTCVSPGISFATIRA